MPITQADIDASPEVARLVDAIIAGVSGVVSRLPQDQLAALLHQASTNSPKVPTSSPPTNHRRRKASQPPCDRRPAQGGNSALTQHTTDSMANAT